MLITDIKKPITSNTVKSIIRENFHYDFPSAELTVSKAAALLKELRNQISNYRENQNYFLSEQDNHYFGMLTTANYLNRYLMERTPRNVKPKQNTNSQANMYKQGINTGIKHGADTTVKFVPHVAGSAIGAFMGGLRGQALSSEAGKVKITELEKELSMIDPKESGKFFQKDAQKHFGQYKPIDKKNIADFEDKLYHAGLEGKPQSVETIEKNIANIAGNPLKDVVDPNLKKKMINHFYEIYQGGVVKRDALAKQSNRLTGMQATKTQGTQTMADVGSALLNQGYSKKNIIDAITAVVGKNPNLKDDFDALFREASNALRK